VECAERAGATSALRGATRSQWDSPWNLPGRPRECRGHARRAWRAVAMPGETPWALLQQRAAFFGIPGIATRLIPQLGFAQDSVTRQGLEESPGHWREGGCQEEKT